MNCLYFLNYCKFEWNNTLNRINKKVDKQKWEMLPHQINAYYHPELNEIVFPAAILQSPFFDINAEDAFNYGAIGTVIGHEITHGFDDQGCKYDENGNLNNWWTKKDLINFKKLAKKIENQFNKCELFGIKVNGKLTLGENIADLGGLTVSYYALLENINNSNSNDKNKSLINFFKSWANIWKCIITDKEQKERLINDPHSPNQFRINMPLTNMDEFYKLYNIKPGDGMYRKERVKIW